MRFLDPIQSDGGYRYKEADSNTFFYLVETDNRFYVKALTPQDKVMCRKCPTTRAEKIIPIQNDENKLSLFNGTYQLSTCQNISNIPDPLKENTLYLYLENEELKIIGKSRQGDIHNFSLKIEKKAEIITAIRDNKPLDPHLLDALYEELNGKGYPLKGYLFDSRHYTREELLQHGITLEVRNFSTGNDLDSRYTAQLQYFLPLYNTQPGLFDTTTLTNLRSIYEELGHLPRRINQTLNALSEIGLLDASNCSLVIQTIRNYIDHTRFKASFAPLANELHRLLLKNEAQLYHYDQDELQKEAQQVEVECRERLERAYNVLTNTNDVLTTQIDRFLNKFISLANRKLLDNDILKFLPEPLGKYNRATANVENCWNLLGSSLTREDMKLIIKHRDNFSTIYSNLEPEVFKKHFNKIKKIATLPPNSAPYSFLNASSDYRIFNDILLNEDAVHEFFSLDFDNLTPSQDEHVRNLGSKISSNGEYLDKHKLLTQENFNILYWKSREFPEIQNLFSSLNAMYEHGMKLRYLPNAKNKTKTCLTLYLDLKKMLKTFLDQPENLTNEKINSFMQEFRVKLHSQDHEMGKHRTLWKVIVANILLAVPLLFKLPYSKIKTGQFQFFFQDTKSIQHIKHIDDSLNLIQETKIPGA